MWNREEIIAVLRVHFKLGSKKGKEKGIIISLPLFKDKGNNMFNKITETDSPPLALFFTPLLLPFHVTFLQLFTSKTNHEKLFQFSLSFSSQNKTEEIFPLELLAHFPFRFPFPYTSSKHKLAYKNETTAKWRNNNARERPRKLLTAQGFECQTVWQNHPQTQLQIDPHELAKQTTKAWTHLLDKQKIQSKTNRQLWHNQDIK